MAKFMGVLFGDPVVILDIEHARMGFVRTLLRLVTSAVVGAVFITACSVFNNAVPSGYEKLRFAPASANNPPTVTITVGTRVAVQALGDRWGWDPPSYPYSGTTSILQPLQWPDPKSAPQGWYPFLALNVGTTDIQEVYPCSGGACAQTLIVVHVIPAAR